MNKKSLPYGGWLINASKTLSENGEVELFIAFPDKKTKTYSIFFGEKITYYAFKEVRNNDIRLINNNHIFENLVSDVKPDIVHIYGTEFAHTLSMINVCNKLRVKIIVSIQGLVSIISKHMLSDLPVHALYGFTLRNILLRDNVIGLKKSFEKRGKFEIEALMKVSNVIGRTTWDKACLSQINPKAKYFTCNETLREKFYIHEWNLDKCEKNSLFVSQGQYPIKGLHYVIEAMPLIMKKFPNAKLYIGGKNITKADTLKDKLFMPYYGKYIKRLINKLKLNNNIIFVGILNESEMCNRYLKSNVFICPSSIENSPNSLAEAMILGVPCVASYVGGIPDMIEHEKEGFLYQADAPYMLAYYVCEILDNKLKAMEISKAAKKHAQKTHDKNDNTYRLIEVYNKILVKD